MPSQPSMPAYPATPPGWSVVGSRSVARFTTHVTYRTPAGELRDWSSRRHRKHASRVSRVRTGSDRVLWAPHRASWWIAVLFAVGSLCFLVGPLPAFLDLVGPQADGAVFFVGSLFFTSAALLQWVETVNADRAPDGGRLVRLRLVSWEPARVDWWSSGAQLVGTLFFNATTFRALWDAIGSPSYDRLVWRPDLLGSVCFLVSGYLAYVEVTGGLLDRPPRGLEGGIVTVNLLGCVAFGVSALAAYVVPGSEQALDTTVANATTSLGALGFLVGALLLLPEGARPRQDAVLSPAR